MIYLHATVIFLTTSLKSPHVQYLRKSDLVYMKLKGNTLFVNSIKIILKEQICTCW